MSWLARSLREFRLRMLAEGIYASDQFTTGYNDYVNCKCDGQCGRCQNFLADLVEAEKRATPIPEGSMRVAPGTDAVVWRVNPEYSGEL